MAYTTFDTDVRNIQKLGDQPNDTDGLSADELKALFDKAGVDLKDFINSTMLPEIFDSVEAAAKGISQEGVPGSSIRDNTITSNKLCKDENNQAVSTATIQNQAVTLGKLSSQLQTLLSNLQTSAQNLTTELGTKVSSNTLSTLAFTGEYKDVKNHPAIPTVDTVLDADSENAVQNKVVKAALDNKANTADLADVATSGAYNDLSGKPTIPTIDTTVTSGSNNAARSGDVYSKLAAKQDKAVGVTCTLASGQTAWTVTVQGVTANNIVLTAPNAAGYAQWVDHRVRCSSQNTNTLGFTADTATTAAITVNVVILG